MSSIALVVLIIILFFIIIGIFSNKENYNSIRGAVFENQVYNILIKYIQPQFVYRNLYITRKNNRLTEIDIVAIHTTGIYVFECKNYSGWIFGSQNNKKWYQTFKTGDKYEFYNPIYQNKIHINAIKYLISNHKVPFYSIIVFSDNCELMDTPQEIENTYIIQKYQLKSLIKELTTGTNIYNNTTLSKINDILYNITISNNQVENKHKHIDDIHDNITKCPYCNGNLIERINKKDNSQFYGCSNYPKCKYTTKNIREII